MASLSSPPSSDSLSSAASIIIPEAANKRRVVSLTPTAGEILHADPPAAKDGAGLRADAPIRKPLRLTTKTCGSCLCSRDAAADKSRDLVVALDPGNSAGESVKTSLPQQGVEDEVPHPRKNLLKLYRARFFKGPRTGSPNQTGESDDGGDIVVLIGHTRGGGGVEDTPLSASEGAVQLQLLGGGGQGMKRAAEREAGREQLAGTQVCGSCGLEEELGVFSLEM